jgi:hypothetical protein
MEAVPFKDQKNGDYRLTGTGVGSRMDVGVDPAVLCAALSRQEAPKQPMCTGPTVEAHHPRALASH